MTLPPTVVFPSVPVTIASASKMLAAFNGKHTCPAEIGLPGREKAVSQTAGLTGMLFAHSSRSSVPVQSNCGNVAIGAGFPAIDS